jgi:hypothetical protein
MSLDLERGHVLARQGAEQPPYSRLNWYGRSEPLVQRQWFKMWKWSAI